MKITDFTSATIARFWSKVKKTEACWEWTGSRDTPGYAVFSLNAKKVRASRVALLLDGRPVPENMLACHHCDNPNCVRPDHLFIGNDSDNMRDASQKGRLSGRPASFKRGSAHRNAKLDEDKVRDIRKLIQQGISRGAIARKYGVCNDTIRCVEHRISWGWLAD